MTDEEAIYAVGLLAGGIGGFTDEAIDVFAKTFAKEDNPDVMAEVCEKLAATWTDRWRPKPAEVLAEYRRHPIVTAERDMRVAAALAKRGSTATCSGNGWVVESDGSHKPCFQCNPFLAYIWPDESKRNRWLGGTSIADLHDDLSTNRSGVTAAEYPMPAPCKRTDRPDPGDPSPRSVSVAEGLAIADGEHRSMFGRSIGEPFAPNPAYAASIVERLGTFDPLAEVWRVKYPLVAAEFRNDHARARASLLAIGTRRLAIDNKGNVVMRPDEPPETPGGQWTGPAPSAPAPTPDRGLGVDPDATPSIGEAIADTIKRLT